MFETIKRWFGGAKAAPSRGRIRAAYDAARTNDGNRRHWANADDLAAEAAASPEVRRVLRKRGRYEAGNNPYTDGMVQTLAADSIGRTPTLQLTTGIESVDDYIEAEFLRWAKAIRLGRKLRTMIEMRASAGEAFALLTSNAKLKTAVHLDIKLLEGDQVATPDLWRRRPVPPDRRTDGIVFDADGNPIEYHILRQHPGDTINLATGPWDYDRVPAERVIHLYKTRRAGQARGIPQITSSLPLFAERRDFRQSVLAAARTAADMGAVTIETDGPADDEEPVVPFETLELERGMMTTLPTGTKARQLTPTQPSTTYAEFDDRNINESARPLSMPFNVAACNSSKYNYASGRLDHQTYDRMIDVDHEDVELEVLDRIFWAWLDEAMAIYGYLPSRNRVAPMVARGEMPHEWLWRGREHVDPVKEAQAQKIRLASRTTTLRREIARDGADLEGHLKQLAREAKQRAALGLSNNEPLTGPQLDAAIEVLGRLRDRTLVAEAAVELLTCVGIPRDRATAAVAGTPTQRKDSSDDILFKRTLVLTLAKDGTISDAIYNAADIKVLLEQVNIDVRSDTDESKLPVVGEDGTVVNEDELPPRPLAKKIAKAPAQTTPKAAPAPAGENGTNRTQRGTP